MTNKKEIILNKTIDLLIQNGVRKTTMEDIAEYSHTSKVTIYKYFIDKDALYYEIGTLLFADYSRQLQNIFSANVAYKQKLYDFLDAINNFFKSGRLDLCKELDKYNEKIAREYQRHVLENKKSILAMIDEGVRIGFIKNDLDRDMIFYYIDMGIVYFQQNEEYRNRLINDDGFQKWFLLFYIGHIFADGTEVLS